MTIAPLSDRNTDSSAAMNWAPISAAVIARESIMTRESRSLHYRAQVDKGEAYLLANAIVSVKVPVVQSQTKLAIPAIAVLHSSAGSYVYLLNDAPEVAMQPAYRAQRQSVTLGEQQGDLIIIESGLEAGDRVASAGAFKLGEGLLTFLPGPVSVPPQVPVEPGAGTPPSEANR